MGLVSQKTTDVLATTWERRKTPITTTLTKIDGGLFGLQIEFLKIRSVSGLIFVGRYYWVCGYKRNIKMNDKLRRASVSIGAPMIKVCRMTGTLRLPLLFVSTDSISRIS